MAKTVFRYGLYAALMIIGISLISFFFILPSGNMQLSEIIGYLTIVLSMIFVFLGIRHFRDRHNGGSLSFGQGLKIGILIILIPSSAFGLLDIVYTEWINPGWKDEYYDNYIAELRKTTRADKLDDAIARAEKQRELFDSPAMQFILMFATVFIIGMIVTIISSLALRRRRTSTQHNQILKT